MSHVKVSFENSEYTANAEIAFSEIGVELEFKGIGSHEIRINKNAKNPDYKLSIGKRA